MEKHVQHYYRYTGKTITTNRFYVGLIYFVFSLGFSSAISANNTWTLTGDLNNPRSHHTSTQLNNNQVLVTGGDMDSVLLGSAELLDLSTSLWSLTSSMNHQREKHVAVLLEDGRVLVAGGSGASADLASAEIYDPLAASWTMITSMNNQRVGALVTKLQDGRVLVSSGTSNGVALNSAEIYDPASDTWTLTGPMTYDTTHATDAILLQDGRVFIMGLAEWQNPLPAQPFDPPNTPQRLPQIYDPVSNSWSTASPMNTPRRGGTAIVLNDGNVFVAGGATFDNVTWDFPIFTCFLAAEIYDPGTNSWTDSTTMLKQSGPSRSSLLPDGTILVSGTNYTIGCSTDAAYAEIYDPGTGIWTVTDRMNALHRDGGVKTDLAEGKVLVTGGDFLRNITEVYTPSGPSPISPLRGQSMHVADLDGTRVENPDGTWTATMTVTVHDEYTDPVYKARVEINSAVCTTNYLGQCNWDVTATSDSVTLNVTGITKSSGDTNGDLPTMTYNAGANVDPDGDSDGTTIVILRSGGSTPPPPVRESAHIADLDDVSVLSGNLWTPAVSVVVRDNLGDIAIGATVRGTWGNGLSGSFFCSVDQSGSCTGTYDGALSVFSAPTGNLTVTDISWVDYPYVASDNSDPDGDSDGTVITLNTPDIPPGPATSTVMFVSDLEGTSKKIGKNSWRATIVITVSDDNGNPVANAEVKGDWTNFGATGDESCKTDDTGSCSVISNRIKNIFLSAVFKVTEIAHSTLSYDASLNSDADGDSGGTFYTVSRP